MRLKWRAEGQTLGLRFLAAGTMVVAALLVELAPVQAAPFPAAGGAAAAGAAEEAPAGWHFETLYAFSALGSDAASGPIAMGGLVADETGVLYGTTVAGGADGYGTVFRLDPYTTPAALEVLHSFAGSDGLAPTAGLVWGPDGALYGTTTGSGPGAGGESPRRATLFRVTPDGSEFETLHEFELPAIEAAGRLTHLTGSARLAALEAEVQAVCGASLPLGEFAADSREDVAALFDALLRTWQQYTYYPVAALLPGLDGALYGTTWNDHGCFGTAFRIGCDGRDFTYVDGFSIAWNDGTTGPAAGFAGLLPGGDGTLYTAVDAPGRGVAIVAIDGAAWTFGEPGRHEILYAGADIVRPMSALTWGDDGALYGTAAGDGVGDLGALYRLDLDGAPATLRVLHRFQGGDGASPYAGLVVGPDGALYGATTMGGAADRGMLFRLDPEREPASLSPLHEFNGDDGEWPLATLLVGQDAALYGLTHAGGAFDGGTLFRLSPPAARGKPDATGRDGGANDLTPTTTTQAATSITATGASLNGSANPNGDASYGFFRYSATNPGTCDDTFGTRVPSSSVNDASLGSGTSVVNYAIGIGGLTPATTYYTCALARNAYGTSFGSVVSFTTSALAPTVTTNAATALTSSTATLNGTANPGGGPTTGWFRYSTTNPGTCDDTFGTRAPATGGSSLGSGTSDVSYSRVIPGLTAGTTYYFCAIAQNSVATGFGSVLSFTTTAAPTVTTNAASSVTSNGATLNGSANPRGAATTGYFRYSLTNPGVCNDSFGTRAPATGGASLGSGSSAVPFAQSVTGLSSLTTYYYCALAQNSEGNAYGAVLTFRTPGPPTTTTQAATSITTTSATLNGSANPNGNASYGFFRYSATNPGTCDDTFGTRVPSSSVDDMSVGSGTSVVNYAIGISGLTPATTYYTCALARNAHGTSFGSVVSFTTSALAPTVTTNAATALTSSTATLNGTANPGGGSTTGWFRYSTTNPGTCNDTFGTRAPATGGSSLGSGTSDVSYSRVIPGLTAGTTYYFCAIAQNSVATAFGSILSFTTTAAPTVTTNAASSVTSNGATLNGSANPRGAATTGYFRYSLTNPGVCNDSFGTRAPATGGASLGSGSSAVPFAQSVTGLSSLTTYYYCALAQNSEGNAYGAVLSFRTPGSPATTTQAATSVTATGATLNGTANPNGNASYGFFRYATTNPGACDDTFGTRVPSSSVNDMSVGSGTSAVNYAIGISGLTPTTTYYACALARNAYGTSWGSVVSFTTPAAAPAVTTGAASAVQPTTVTLNGTANPGGAATTGWFRYATTNPGTCDDTFGTRAPAAGGSTLGSGTSAVAYSQGPTGLAPNTTYYFCAIAQNSAGTGFGAVLSFTTGHCAPEAAETCDGLDNNCDGNVDEGVPDELTSCGLGICAASGTASCIGGVWLDDCTPGTPAPAEACNGLDDDCDGSVPADEADPDTDGWLSCADVCPAVYDPDQADLDLDGLGDPCDDDDDGDLVADTGDNCPTVANPEQTDYDQDGMGDPCDLNGIGCRNGLCEPELGEHCGTCPDDCGTSCSDANPCTEDRCDPESGCVFTPLADGTSCADADVCNGTETCASGVCSAGTPVVRGDVVDDGVLSSGDAQLAFFIALEIVQGSERERCAADCNGDGVVSSGDAQRIFLAALSGGQCPAGL